MRIFSSFRALRPDRWHVGCAERERFVAAPRPLND
jgi:hypothetical protein